MRPFAPSAALLLTLTACGQTPAPAAASPHCEAGRELFRGACVDPAKRYEPAARADHANVVAYGDPLTQLTLPDPPKSGFRIVAPPRTMKAGEEVDMCLSWPFPAITNHVVYAGRMYTTPGLHHSNVITKSVDPKLGPNPYPGCNPGASDPFSQLPSVIPDVLFANSTQIVGEETLAFPAGMGFHTDPTREITTDIHFLNSTGADLRVEVAYDFFTMPDADLETEVAPFFMQVNQFKIPPHSTGDVGATCSVFGGQIVSMMPHTHKLLSDFTVDLLRNDGKDDRVLESGAFSTTSGIRLYQPELDLDVVDKVRFNCAFDNTTNHDVVYGIGENEMCILFGYLYPVNKQFVAYSKYQGQPCSSVQIGLFR